MNGATVFCDGQRSKSQRTCRCETGICEILIATNMGTVWKIFCFETATVDGRNPGPGDRQFIPLFTGIYTFQVVGGEPDFFHQQYDTSKNVALTV